MKSILQFIAMLLIGLFSAQTLKPIAKKIADAEKQKVIFEKIKPLEAVQNSINALTYKKAAKDAEVLKLNLPELKKIINEKPNTIEITIPFKGEDVVVRLIKNQIFTQNFVVNSNKSQSINYTPGVYYHGIIKNDVASLAAFSFFENDVVAVISDEKYGNVVIGKAKDASDFLIYSESSLTGTNPFICASDELKENQNFKPANFTNKAVATPTYNCVRVYYEVAYRPYLNNGSNITTTTNWITSIHNNISTLYSNDEIRTALSEIYIWTTPDPYTGSHSANLAAFRVNRPTFNGDLGHLINSPSTTSVAYLNSLCSSFKHAYSGVSQSYQQVPTYSWTIMAMTHEMGHALGSPHTHACAWNGNNTAIDGCGPTSGNNEGCNAPLPPQQGGTIMSYCHLVNSVGINFANGFGVQPSALIRNTVDSKGCLGTNCTTSCLLNVSNVTTNQITSNSAITTFTDDTGTSWKYRIKTMSDAVITSGNITSKTINHTGLQPNTYYKVEIGDNCSGPNAFQVSNIFLTDANWCDPTIKFVDTGGETGNYGNSETIIKTFYPSSPNQKLQLTFSKFDLEADYDFMTIYDGTSTSAPVFANGNNLSGNVLPPVFNATNSDGAITVKFTSDGGVVNAGWVAKLECVTLSTSETNGQNSIEIYPNPTSNIININSKNAIIAYELVDASARIVKQEKVNNQSQFKIDITSLPKGVYLLKLKTKSQQIQEKIIKN